jgi:type IV pilus assembly protein PilZ
MANRDSGDPKRNEAENASDLDSSDLNSRHERRSSTRFDVTWSVDCETEETFLYAAIANISELGIFVRTTDPLSTGTQLTLRFVPPDASDPFVLKGTVQWVNVVRPMHDNPNPGMGIRFVDLTLDDRERLVATIRTIAYLREGVLNRSTSN